jgi:hypothetical protein
MSLSDLIVLGAFLAGCAVLSALVTIATAA